MYTLTDFGDAPDSYGTLLSSNGAELALDGEVEDYIVEIVPITTGTIIIEKQTEPDGAYESFEFSTNYSSNFSLLDNETNNSGFLDPGIYSVSEINIPTGWNLICATCDDGSDPSAIDLQAGETIICTFNNTMFGYLVAIKYHDLNGNGVPDYAAPDNEPRLDGWVIALKDQSGDVVATGTTGANGTGRVEFHNLVPGTYTVCETQQAGWFNTEPGTLCRTVQVRAGKKAVARFGNNYEPGTINIEKQTIPSGGTGFEFSTNFGPNFILDDCQTYTVSSLVPGNYTITEVDPIANLFFLSGLSIVDSNPGGISSSSDLSTRTVTVNLDDGETVTAIFTNTYDKSLPVEINYFNAEIIQNNVLLSWETGSEIENRGFEVYRSLDENSDYQLISSFINNPKLAGHGNTSNGYKYSYIDYHSVEGTIWYKLADVTHNNIKTCHDPISISVTKEEGIPDQINISQNYPNPFNPTTTISYQIKEATNVELYIYDMLGQKVKTLISEYMNPGYYDITWNATNDIGDDLPSGIYIVRFKIQNIEN